MLGSQVKLPDANWHVLGMAWIAYSIFMASINAYVAFEYSTEEWVNFKMWGYIFPLTFLVGTGIYMAKHVTPSENNAEDESSK